MGRAEKVEEAARALCDAIQEIPNNAEGWGAANKRDNLRAALALPADEAAQPAPEWAGEAVAWQNVEAALREWEGRVVIRAKMEGAKEDGIAYAREQESRALMVALGAIHAYAAHPTPRAEAASAERAAKAEAAAHRREALARDVSSAAMRVVEALPCYLGHTPEQTHLCHACKAREAIRSLPLPAAPASAEAVAREAADHAAMLGYQSGYLHGWDTRGDERKNPREAGRDKAIADSAARAVAHALRAGKVAR